MRHLVTSLLILGCLSSSGSAFQARSAGAPAGKACELLTRDLAMKVSSAAGRQALERARPSSDTEGMTLAKGASLCDYGRITLILDPFARPDQILSAMRARNFPYTGHEPVPGLGDAAFFESNSAFANLYVWTGSRPFHIQMSSGYDEEAKSLRPNTIALARAIIDLSKE
jgi:hypothetical protein